ncbi:bifunctional proline dehydrogenase/L-glutamate gamma-semialdehyde dehydrogenase PutA [Bowmanella yangjiangensis]|uniref:Bifunctional protein PutA n=1 Tax=Bowmanella yangjiangensis TaxID=2811230 RepID=A0ABS3CVE6_9ALTE|nr:bifunctional proline dehydrogenase/L-glutamate gamma-semialdehyde dehydrogenase PutA [Bowmanella yangjiangensis]MBN7820499.1 bifunctional proline dehydrogenase/L-glutamate gamma-semialdehyde dehydrogenase PutA [Bowmanella yangjiangensis]
MLFSAPFPPVCERRQLIRDHFHCDEADLVSELIPLARLDDSAKASAKCQAHQLVKQMQQAAAGLMESLLQEYALSSEEGVILMCLAEALLRIPDKATRDALIAEKLGQGNWQAHLGNSASGFVNLSSLGLLTGKKMLNEKRSEALFNRMLKRLGSPLVRSAMGFAMTLLGGQFVTGQSIEKARQNAQSQEQLGYRYSYDMLGEGARTQQDADRYFASYQHAIQALVGKHSDIAANPGISVKLSAIHPRYELAQKDRVMKELVPRLLNLAMLAKQQQIGLTVDAEEANRLDLSLDVIEAVFLAPELADWNGFGLAVQAYQKRALPLVKWLADLAQQAKRRLNVRLVKGAYWDSEIKLAQQQGLADYPVFTRKQSTDVSYLACARELLNAQWIYPQFATHNAYTLACILEMAQDRRNFEFQRLHGMGEAMYNDLVQSGKAHCRIYAPVGKYADLLPYLVRRLLENGANTSFVNLVQNKQLDLSCLLADPVDALVNKTHKRNPHIPLPADIYGPERPNARGLDSHNDDELIALNVNLQNWWQTQSTQALHKVDNVSDAPTLQIRNPADRRQLLATLIPHDQAGIEQAITQANAAFESWSARTADDRAEVLQAFAELLETHQDELLGLCIKEAGKTLDDAIAEVREAVDFCRYYAVQIKQYASQPELNALGTVLCISPWNFPLAIFVGQVVAALVAGNTVVAKPAEQTSLIALRATALLYTAGLTPNALQIVLAKGSLVGQVALPDPRIQAVMFTGSNPTCAHIAKQLAKRGEAIPLIAETGGQNTMIVDSTALLEQVVDDVIQSGFKSAGQRCSALRVLYVQDDIADALITMLQGAMQELRVGDPALLATDIGPLIDTKALDNLERHARRMDNEGVLLAKINPDSEMDQGYFFAPRLYEIKHISQLQEEVFGPCVHLIRFQAAKLNEVVEQINSTGFGLTAGIHSRLANRAEQLTKQIQVGNLYVNRNMVGAVVGVQPFGGRGLSGTGPKAGGPLYLSRLLRPAATGINVQTSWPDALPLDVPAPVIDKQRLLRWQATTLSVRETKLSGVLSGLLPMGEGLFIAQQQTEQRYSQARQYLAKANCLPGPTGERNELHFEPRGWLLYLYDARFDAHLQDALVSALISGNGLLIAGLGQLTGALKTLGKSELPIELTQFTPKLLTHPDIKGVICAPDGGYHTLVQQALASRAGPLLPLICEPTGLRLLQRMWLEKTITVNTTAIGGNASLMLLDDEPEHAAPPQWQAAVGV